MDLDFAEFCIQLPDSLKINSTQDKIILREAMQAYWTESIRNRGKQGFGSSVENWFTQNSLLEMSKEILGSPTNKIYNFLDFNETQKLLQKVKKHWNLLQLALWAEYHF